MQILPRPAYLNGLIMVKLKGDLKYKGYVYFEPVRLNFIYIPSTKFFKSTQ